MAETHETTVYARRAIDPPSEPDEHGMIAVEAFETTYADHALITDVDDNPLGVQVEYYTARSVHRVPPDSPRRDRLRHERELADDTTEEGNQG